MKITVKGGDIEIVFEQEIEVPNKDNYYHFTSLSEAIGKVIVDSIRAIKEED